MIKVKFLFFVFLLVLVGCNQGEWVDEQPAKPVEGEVETEADVNLFKDEITIKVWSYYEAGLEEAFQLFRVKYPNIKFELEMLDYENYHNVYFEALVNGEGPDIMFIDSPHFGEFNSIEIFQDLLEEPFSMGDYQQNFSESLWNVGQSFDRKKMVGFPVNTAPHVTFYRADIMEEYGFPSDPEELGNYMEDPTNWLTMANELKKDSKYLIQWPNNIREIYDTGTAIFDEDLNFMRNTPEYEQMIELARLVRHDSLTLGIDIWLDQEPIKNDELVMLFLGTWGSDLLKSWVPDQKGKWRVTRLPFNIYGWSNSAIMSIPLASENKKAAWEFIKFYSIELTGGEDYIVSVPGYLPSRGNERARSTPNYYLGGQQPRQYYEDLIYKTKEHIITPLDKDAEKIWSDNFEKGIQWNISGDEIIKRTKEDIENQHGRVREILLESKNNSQ
ncbi:ABC transporter substrate-binding protein [Bacillus alkalicellulosilyticus]|uniref:ABC transporter substrate-binding protein n=1 Tax=Alkalihalobacterium alkalicellulosilyticum TaxID=1912214 RepID=UPI0009989BA3|nr:extracellular solute-binding protein [Bacillus alkalicellulosilyticus]